MKHERTNRLRDGRGVGVASTAIAIVAFLALAVVAIDVGHLAHTATEVQMAADVAATAGAKRLIDEITPIENGGGGNTCAGAETAALSDARAVVNENRVAGAEVSTFDNANVVIEVGRWNNATGFTPSTILCNAVQATVTAADVPNIVAGIWPGNEASSVTKVAVAGVGSLGVAGPDLPLMIGECCPENEPPVTENCAPANDDCSQPVEVDISVPDGTMNTGWTDWVHRPAHSVDDCMKAEPDKYPDQTCTLNDYDGKYCCGVQQFLPEHWCAFDAPTRAGCPEVKEVADFGGCGLGVENPQICTVTTCADPADAEYNVQESQGGVKTTPWIIADGVLQGEDTFTIPIIECSGKTTTKTLGDVIGFATIQFDQQDLADDICGVPPHDGAWDTKRFKITFLCNADEPGPVGGGTGGLPTGPVVLLK